MNISDRIQGLRKIKGISQEELADRIGVSRQAVSKWESEQSTPDIDKIIIMSEYFDVTTDYILKGMEAPQQLENKNFITSQILYIASTAFLIIGLLCAFSSWYAEQSAEGIWGSMIIQVVGAAAYFTGKLISQSKASYIINLLNIIIALFMPISLIISFIFKRGAAPYPTDITSGFVLAAVYIVIMAISVFVIKKRRNCHNFRC
ncbi:helix-turn-helix domain-containing protein [Schnuerera sp. xch1]|uniref:helix-turn-helix domain-containing protein n=1 Tax=Schnuerera sp. xch1 TaxID=2874283 RepID=UPI001CBE584A|nr:helix-turn-helix transcriptional regulator [Schnuerera sp. xch1]MBZ2175756.1 helix-turn-helix domain-containing protein [Schnuerera sp. xch1]